GSSLLVAVDDRQPGYSVGMTNFELALAMMQLGCVTASALDSGDSTTVAFDGQLLNRPSDPDGERSVAEALLVAYSGVYAPPASEPVLSPNGDGVANRKSTRLNSSHVAISYAVFCLKKKNSRSSGRFHL